jgi:hypothetical protein
MNRQRFLTSSLQLLLPLSLLWASLLSAAEPAKADAPAADNNACTWVSSIDDWRELDNRNLIVWASRTEFYHLELSAPLIDLGSAESLAFGDHNHDGRVCGYGMDEVIVPHSTAFGRATIISMTRLDDAGLTQLAEQYHIKLKPPKAKSSAADASKPAKSETAAK